MIHDEIGLAQSFPHCAREFPDFPVFPDFPGVAECGVDPALSELSAHQMAPSGVPALAESAPHSSPSELSAHQMARPGHLRTQAYRSIFSQACDHGFQFSSMSGLPNIHTHKSPPGSLLSDPLGLLAHIQLSSLTGASSWIVNLLT